MRGNSFGTAFRLTTFGESHGAAIGGVIDGCPAGLALDLDRIQQELDRRRPGSTPLGTTRSEGDRVEFLSGIFAVPGQAQNAVPTTLGTPIGFVIRNNDARSGDYDHLKEVFRPGHADLTWDQKFGIRDHRGGGRSSARETASRVVAGAIARQLIEREGVKVDAYVSQVGPIMIKQAGGLDLEERWSDPVRCPDPATSAKMRALIEDVRNQGDSIGGMVHCIISGLPIGLGEPVFDRLDADLAKAMLSINATKGFQIGSGFQAAAMRGSEHNDPLIGDQGRIRSEGNRSGGLLGGISNGGDLYFDVAFKPPATIAKAQHTVDLHGNESVLQAKGRHDPCVVPRAVPIVEAMACLVIADHLVRQRTSRV